jgi:transposase InsO family protein
MEICEKTGLKPERILSDRGPQFKHEIWQRTLNTQNIKCCMASIFYPQSDGLVERCNQNILGKLRILCVGEEHKWQAKLKQAIEALNNSPASATKIVPKKFFDDKVDRIEKNLMISELIKNIKKNDEMMVKRT